MTYDSSSPYGSHEAEPRVGQARVSCQARSPCENACHVFTAPRSVDEVRAMCASALLTENRRRRGRRQVHRFGAVLSKCQHKLAHPPDALGRRHSYSAISVQSPTGLFGVSHSGSDYPLNSETGSTPSPFPRSMLAGHNWLVEPGHQHARPRPRSSGAKLGGVGSPTGRRCGSY